MRHPKVLTSALTATLGLGLALSQIGRAHV